MLYMLIGDTRDSAFWQYLDDFLARELDWRVVDYHAVMRDAGISVCRSHDQLVFCALEVNPLMSVDDIADVIYTASGLFPTLQIRPVWAEL